MLKKFVSAGVGAFLLATPFLVSAQTVIVPVLPANPTIAQVQAQIQILTQLLAQLMAKSTTTVSNTITVASASQPANGLAPQGANVPFTTFSLTNNSRSTTTISSITIYDNGSGTDAAFAYLSLRDQNNTVVSGPAQFTAGTHQALLSSMISLNPGQTNIYTVYGAMAPNLSPLTGKAVSLAVTGINSAIPLNGNLPVIGATQSINSTLNVCFPPQTSIYGYQCWGTTTTGVTAKLIASNPNPLSYAQIQAGATGVIVGTFSLAASGAAVSLQQIGVSLNSNYASAADLQNGAVSIWNGSTLVGQVNFSGSTAVNGFYHASTTLLSALNLPLNQQVGFTIKADIAQIGVGQSGSDGHEILVNLADAVALATSSAALIHTGPVSTLPAGVAIFRSIPVVMQNALPSSGASDGRLIAFAITANSNGPIGLSKFDFNVAPSTGASVTAPHLFAYADPSLSMPISASTSTSGLGATTLSGTSASTVLSAPIEIPAGQTYYFILKGTVSSTAATYSVAATLSGASASLAPTMAIASNLSAQKFIWSPNGQGTSALTTADWTNGYGVMGLPAAGITQVRAGSGTTAMGTTEQLSNMASALLAIQSVLNALGAR